MARRKQREREPELSELRLGEPQDELTELGRLPPSPTTVPFYGPDELSDRIFQQLQVRRGQAPQAGGLTAADPQAGQITPAMNEQAFRAFIDWLQSVMHGKATPQYTPQPRP